MANSAITGPVLSDVKRSPAGTAAAPSWSFADSTGTGAYLVSSNVFGVSTAGLQRMVVDASGNVGIGTGSPQNYGAGTTTLTVDSTSISTIDMRISGTRYGHIDATTSGFVLDTWSGATPIIFKTNTNERMRIDASGNVGIGTGSPGAKLDVVSTNQPVSAISARYNLSNAPISFGVANANGYPYIGWNTKSIQSSDSVTYDISNFATQLRMDAGQFRFNIASSGTAGNTIAFTQAMTLDSGGRLSVGNNSGSNTIGALINIESGGLNAQNGYGYYYNAAAPSAAGFYVNSPQSGTATTNWFAFYSRVAGADRFYVNGAGTIFSTNTSVQPIASDISLKQDIIDYDKGLSEILKMKPRCFSWKTEPERKDVGFIAQEMDEALPGSMIENKEGHKTYHVEWYPILVKAIQEQQEIISKLEARIATLESK